MISSLTEPSAGHMPRGGRPKSFVWWATARCTWISASRRMSERRSGMGTWGMASRADSMSQSNGRMG